jgi:hypothetical protein
MGLLCRVAAGKKCCRCGVTELRVVCFLVVTLMTAEGTIVYLDGCPGWVTIVVSKRCTVFRFLEVCGCSQKPFRFQDRASLAVSVSVIASLVALLAMFSFSFTQVVFV